MVGFRVAHIKTTGWPTAIVLGKSVKYSDWLNGHAAQTAVVAQATTNKVVSNCILNVLRSNFACSGVADEGGFI